MAYIDLITDPSPSGTGFDDSLPTRNTELLSAQMHNTIQDMADDGWHIDDGSWSNNEADIFWTYIKININNTFNYAKDAIVNYRTGGDPLLPSPSTVELHDSISTISYHQLKIELLRSAIECYRVCVFVYYMWETEEDPLLIKEYIRDLLNSWPLLDTQINLSDETGQAFRVFPAWNNIE